MDPIDTQLLIDTHRGDHDAAVRLHVRMAPRMLAYARAILNHDAAAEDAVQQVFLRILTLGRDEVTAVTDALAWLIRLTRNAALNNARSDQRARDRARPWRPYSATLGPSPGDPHEELLEAIGELEPDARELIVLKHVAGLTFDQMAVSLGDSRGTVVSRYRSALDRLRASTRCSREAEEASHG